MTRCFRLRRVYVISTTIRTQYLFWILINFNLNRYQNDFATQNREIWLTKTFVLTMILQSCDPLYNLLPDTHNASTMPSWPSRVFRHFILTRVSHTCGRVKAYCFIHKELTWQHWHTRMHSSRMRTARTLTDWGGVCRGGVCQKGGCLPEGGCLPGGGVGECLPGGCLPGVGGGGVCRGVSARGGVCQRGVYHVTYPIMHLMLPVCCLHTNWDSPAVQLLLYCLLIMWPARHAGIPTPPLWTEFLTHAYENITLPQLRCGR